MTMEGMGGSGSTLRKERVKKLLDRLNLHEQEGDGVVWEEEIVEPPAVIKWLAIARVHTTRGFSPTTLYSDMRSAWNPTREVVWRRVQENLFDVQFGCLAGWNKAMTMAPWLFRYQVVILEEYDGFEDPRSVVLNQIAVWASVLRLPDNLLHDVVIRGMCRPMGKILALQIKLLAGYV